MTKPIEEIDDPRMVKALAQPLRVRVPAVVVTMLFDAPTAA